jgi:acetyltransferase-like isoleucine patch superfamily enzyme
MNKKTRAILTFPLALYLQAITYLPGEIGFFLRARFWRKRLKILGDKSRIDIGVYFQNPECISIGTNCWIDRGVVILAGIDYSNREKIIIKNKHYTYEKGTVFIGDNVHIGIGCSISGISAGVYISNDCGLSAKCSVYAFSHHYKSKQFPKNKTFSFGPMIEHDRQCLIEGPIFIGKNTGIALNATILPGVSILENSFVAINSVVMAKKYTPNSLISGNPAKAVGDRFDADE